MRKALIWIFIGLIIGSFLTHMIKERMEKKSYRKFSCTPPKIDSDFCNTILMVGIGGVGKTSLIKSLLSSQDANPDKKTEKFDIYIGKRSSEVVSSKGKVNDSKHREYAFIIADYRGQNLGTLIRSFILEQRKKESYLAYGYITSLIVVVDILNSERMNNQIEEWNDTDLDSIFGLLTSELKYICLFINKYDLINTNQCSLRNPEEDRPPTKQELIEYFNPIVEKLKDRCNAECTFENIVGSAENGDQINKLTDRLIEFSLNLNEHPL